MIQEISYTKPMKRKIGGHALAESPGCWEPGRKQTVKWTTEGAVKGLAEYAATCGHTSVAEGMICTLQSARLGRESRWHRES